MKRSVRKTTDDRKKKQTRQFINTKQHNNGPASASRKGLYRLIVLFWYRGFSSCNMQRVYYFPDDPHQHDTTRDTKILIPLRYQHVGIENPHSIVWSYWNPSLLSFYCEGEQKNGWEVCVNNRDVSSWQTYSMTTTPLIVLFELVLCFLSE